MQDVENNQMNRQVMSPLLRSYVDIIREVQGTYDKNLYHYTTVNGLLGIIESNSIWCTNALYMNDTSELKVSLYVIKESIEIMNKKFNDPFFYALLKDAYDNITKGITVYTASFSENGDLLSQWRAYSDMGNGYAVGLSLAGVKQLKLDSRFSVLLRKVVYDPNKQFTIMNEIIETIHNHYQIVLKNSENLYNTGLKDQLSLEIGYIFIDVMTWFKHPTFEEEKEWRTGIILFDYNSDKIRFRPGYRKIISYLSVMAEPNSPSNKLLIKEIITGPMLNKELTHLSLYLLLEKHKYLDVEVKHSIIPLCS